MKKSESITALVNRLNVENKSSVTVRHYTESVERFISWCEKNKRDSLVKYVQGWILALRWVNKLAPASINLHTNAVRYYCNFILQQPIPLDIVPRMKEKKELPEPLTIDEVKKIFAMENNRKHLALLQVAYYGGLRLGDIQWLRVQDIRFERGVIHVRDGKGQKDRLVMLPDCVHPILRDTIAGKGQADFVFTPQYGQEQYPKRTIQKIFENACARAGIQGRHNIHRLRHSYACHMLRRGANLRVLQETMGHASITTTQRYLKVAGADISDMRNILTMEN
jgi:site-specific recombinase XerD